MEEGIALLVSLKLIYAPLVAVSRNKGVTLVFLLKDYTPKLASCLNAVLFYVFLSHLVQNIVCIVIICKGNLVFVEFNKNK